MTHSFCHRAVEGRYREMRLMAGAEDNDLYAEHMHHAIKSAPGNILRVDEPSPDLAILEVQEIWPKWKNK